MGTNYYIKTREAEDGPLTTNWHLGKQSCGWNFKFSEEFIEVLEDQGFPSFIDGLHYYSHCIFDEFGDNVPLHKLLFSIIKAGILASDYRTFKEELDSMGENAAVKDGLLVVKGDFC